MPALLLVQRRGAGELQHLAASTLDLREQQLRNVPMAQNDIERAVLLTHSQTIFESEHNETTVVHNWTRVSRRQVECSSEIAGDQGRHNLITKYGRQDQEYYQFRGCHG